VQFNHFIRQNCTYIKHVKEYSWQDIPGSKSAYSSQFVTFWVNLNFGNTYTLLNILIAFGLVYRNTPITDLICALSGPYAAMFVTRIYRGKSLNASFVSPGKS